MQIVTKYYKLFLTYAVEEEIRDGLEDVGGENG